MPKATPAFYEGKRAVDFFAAQFKKLLPKTYIKPKHDPYGYLYFTTLIRPLDCKERYYVGQSTKMHLMGEYKGSGLRVTRTIAKYGDDCAHVVPLLPVASRKELDYLECIAVALSKLMFADDCVNVRGGGGGSGEHDEKTRQRMSDLKVGRTTYNDGVRAYWLYPDDPRTSKLLKGAMPRPQHTEAYKKKMSKSLKGRTHTAHTRELLRIATSRLEWFNDGSRNYRLANDDPARLAMNVGVLRSGRKASAATKAKIAESSKDREWYNDGLNSFRLKDDDPRIAYMESGRLPHGKFWYNDGKDNYMIKPEDSRTLVLSPGRITPYQPSL